MRHGDDVVAGIDEVDFAGDAGREIGQKIKPGAAELVERYAAMQRRMTLLESEHRARVADTGARQGADWARGDRIDANGAATEIDGKIADRSFERCLGDAHGVVIRHRP